VNAPEFFQSVREMREAQRRYFKQRDNLPQCKALEARVDAVLAYLIGPPQLFDQQARTERGAHDATT
jgi:hypothetical protein